MDNYSHQFIYYYYYTLFQELLRARLTILKPEDQLFLFFMTPHLLSFHNRPIAFDVEGQKRNKNDSTFHA